MALPELISRRGLLQPARPRGRDDLAGRHQDRLPGAVEGPAERVGAGPRSDGATGTRPLRDRRRQPQRAQLRVDRRSALAALRPGQRRRRELARVPGRPGEPGRPRRRSHAVPRREGLLRTARRHARQGDRSPQQAGPSTLFDVYELDIATGELTLLAENPGHGRRLALRPQRGPVRHGADRRRRHRAVRWDAATQTLRSIATFDGADYPMGVYPMVVTPDGTGVWIGSNRGTRPDPAGAARPGHRRGDRGRQPPDIRPGHARPGVADLPPPLILEPADRRTARGALSR